MTQESMEIVIAQTIIDTLCLEDISPQDIDPEAPLFNDGLGLDSIDGLELSVYLSKAYNLKLQKDDPKNKDIFSSLRSLTRYIENNC